MNIVRLRQRPTNATSQAIGRPYAAAKVLVGALFGPLCATGWSGGVERTARAAETDLPAANSSAAPDKAPSAAEKSNDSRRASTAFELGLELSRQKRFAEARESFWAAFALRPHALASYNAALTCRALGDLPGALQALDTTLARPAEELTVAERQAVEKARAEVAQLLASNAAPSVPTAPQSPVATAAPTAPPLAQKVQLWCDLPNVAVSAAGEVLVVTGPEPRSVDIEVPPGTASITLTRDGYTSQTIEVHERHAKCALVALARADATPIQSESHASKRAPAAGPKDVAEHGGTPNVVYWLGGAGLVLAVAGAGIWLYDNQRYTQWRANDGDASEQDDLRDSILLWDQIAATSGAAGAALLIAGGIVYWSDGSSANPGSSANAGSGANSGSKWVIGPSWVHFAHTW